MFIQSALVTYRNQKVKTSQPLAWKNNKYETYRINFPIPAARLHESGTKNSGHWFAVDSYDVSIESYHDKLALVDIAGKATKFKNPSLEIYLLSPGTIVNVGLAKSQGFHSGGGWQFEFVEGFPPVHIEHINKPERVQI